MEGNAPTLGLGLRSHKIIQNKRGKKGYLRPVPYSLFMYQLESVQTKWKTNLQPL
jgi:hypothetical protein